MENTVLKKTEETLDKVAKTAVAAVALVKAVDAITQIWQEDAKKKSVENKPEGQVAEVNSF